MGISCKAFGKPFQGCVPGLLLIQSICGGAWESRCDGLGCQLSKVLVQQQSPTSGSASERVSEGSFCELVDWAGKICPQWGRLTPLVETWIRWKGRGIWIAFLSGAGTKELQVFRLWDLHSCFLELDLGGWTTSPSLVLRSFTTDWAKMSAPLTLQLAEGLEGDLPVSSAQGPTPITYSLLSTHVCVLSCCLSGESDYRWYWSHLS